MGHSTLFTPAPSVLAPAPAPGAVPAQAFDELLLLKRGGRTIYHGPLGVSSTHLIQYFTVGRVWDRDSLQQEVQPSTFS